jgi:hypothetical protein
MKSYLDILTNKTHPKRAGFVFSFFALLPHDWIFAGMVVSKNNLPKVSTLFQEF